MGGQIALLMGTDYPEKTKGIVLIDTPFRTPPKRFLSFTTSCSLGKGFLATFLRRFFLRSPRITRILASAYGRKPTPQEVEGYLTPLKIPGTAHSFLRLAKAPLFSLNQLRGKVHPPLFVIWGKRDRWVPVKQARQLINAFPQASLYLIGDASHCPMETHPQEFYPLLIRLLNQ